MNPRTRSHTGLLVVVVVVMIGCLLPFAWLVQLSLRSGADLSHGGLLPQDPSLTNYLSVLTDGDFLVALRNSAFVASSVTLLSLLLGAPSAYALARLRFRGRRVILILVLSISTFPVIVLAGPLFSLWVRIGLYNTLPGLILPYLTLALPLTTFILVGFFREVPMELEEAALVDGLSRLRALVRVILPVSGPGLAAAGLLTFIFAWNEFLLAITLTSRPEVRTVPAAIAFFTGSIQYEQPLGTIAAASVIVSLPLVALVLLFQNRIVAGLTAGSVKG